MRISDPAISRIASVLICGLALCRADPARADPFGFELGFQLGSRTTASIWRDIGRGDRCDSVGDPVPVATRSASAMLRSAHHYDQEDSLDYAEGYLHGLRETLGDLAVACPDSCGSIGEAAGTASAIVYCELASRFGEIPVFARMHEMPPITCGEPFRIACEVSFETLTIQDCPQYSAVAPSYRALYEDFYLADRGGTCSEDPPDDHDHAGRDGPPSRRPPSR